MSGRSPPLYCTLIILITMHSHQSYPNITTAVINSYEYRVVLLSIIVPSRHRGIGAWVISKMYTLVYCVCVFFPFILDINGRTSRGHTGGRSHRIFHPPSFCGACLYFSREKDSAIPFCFIISLIVIQGYFVFAAYETVYYYYPV